MMRNIQNRYTQEELLEEMCRRGFEGCFDFFYLPTDFSTKKNKGYAFVNFLSADIAQRFRAEFDNKALPRYHTTHKVVEMSAAETQGLHNNARKYLKQQAHRVLNPWFKPMIFKQVGDDLVCYPLCADHMPKDVLEDAKGNNEGARSLANLSPRDSSELVPPSFNWSENDCDGTVSREGEGEVVNDVEVLRSLMEAAVLEICQVSTGPPQYQ